MKFTHSWPHHACSALIQEDWWKTVAEVAEMLDIWPIETCNSQQKRGLLSKTVLLHHDSACPHTVVTAIKTIWNFKFEVLPQPPYSPDLASCHFCAVGPLKEALRGCWFGSGEVKLALHAWIWKQPKTCFPDEIKQIMDCKKGAWNCRETMLKNNRGVMYIPLSLWLVRGYCLYLFIHLWGKIVWYL
jgi:hypothetical protein